MCTHQEAYPHKFHTTHMIKDFIAEFSSIEDGSHICGVTASIAGRLTAKRIQGKLLFYDIVGDGMKVQIMSDVKNMHGGEEKFREIHALLKRGDIVGVTGYPGKSKKGELSIFPTDLVSTISFSIISHDEFLVLHRLYCPLVCICCQLVIRDLKIKK